MADGGPQHTIGVAAPGRKRPFGRSLGDFRIEGAATPNGLYPAEERLLVCAARGAECEIASKRPEEEAPENTVRGSFLRFLLLGGDDNAPVHEKGIILRGAFVAQAIDLTSAKGICSISILSCLVSDTFWAKNAVMNEIIFSGTKITSLSFNSANILGNVFLDDNFECYQEIDLKGARINGDLNCDGGRVLNPKGFTLNAENAIISGNVFLRSDFVSHGILSFRRAEIKGSFGCDGGTFINKEEYGNLSNMREPFSERAIDLSSVRVGGGILVWLGFWSPQKVGQNRRFIGFAWSLCNTTF